MYIRFLFYLHKEGNEYTLDDLSIRIKILLNQLTATKDIKSQLKQIENELNGINIKINTSSLEEVKNKNGQLTKTIQTTKNAYGELEQVIRKLNSKTNEWAETTRKVTNNKAYINQEKQRLSSEKKNLEDNLKYWKEADKLANDYYEKLSKQQSSVKTKEQTKIEDVTGITSFDQRNVKSAKEYQAVWDKAYADRIANIKKVEQAEMSLAQNGKYTQMFQDFNKSIGIGQSTGINESNSALKQYYESVHNLSKVSNVPVLDAINKNFSNGSINKITEQNSALKSYYDNIDRINKLNTVKLSDVSQGVGNNYFSKSAKDSAGAFEELFKKSSLATGSMTDTERATYKLNPEMKKLSENADKAGQSIFDAGKKFASWLLIGSAIMMPLRMINQALDEIKNVDTQLSEIAKVLNTTISDIQYLGDESFRVANKFGASATGYLEALTAMSRAGYRETAQGLGEVSLMAQTAGDLTAQLANDWILAADAAYKLKGNTSVLTEILDKSNQLTNRNAVEMKDLAEGYKVAGSQTAQMGLTVEETNAAIGTMVAVTRQGGNIAGRALKGETKHSAYRAIGM